MPPNDHTSVRALIAGYKACERPSEATEARIQRALASAQRRHPAPRSASRLTAAAPWLALAAALLLLFAWQAGAPRQLTRDRDSLSKYTAPPPALDPVSTRPPLTLPAIDVTRSAPSISTDETATDIIPKPSARDTDHTPSPSAPGDTNTPPAPGAARAHATSSSHPRKTAPASESVLAEMALLQRAQEALRAQRPADALTVLDQHDASFPRGELAEERQALRITALCADGSTAQGLALRATFTRVYPRSAYATRVAAACPLSKNESTDSSISINGTTAGR